MCVYVCTCVALLLDVAMSLSELLRQGGDGPPATVAKATALQKVPFAKSAALSSTVPAGLATVPLIRPPTPAIGALSALSLQLQAVGLAPTESKSNPARPPQTVAKAPPQTLSKAPPLALPTNVPSLPDLPGLEKVDPSSKDADSTGNSKALALVGQTYKVSDLPKATGFGQGVPLPSWQVGQVGGSVGSAAGLPIPAPKRSEVNLKEKPLYGGGVQGPISSRGGVALGWNAMLHDEPRRSFIGHRSGAFTEDQLNKWWDRLGKGLRWERPMVRGKLLPRYAAWLTKDGFVYIPLQWDALARPDHGTLVFGNYGCCV